MNELNKKDINILIKLVNQELQKAHVNKHELQKLLNKLKMIKEKI